MAATAPSADTTESSADDAAGAAATPSSGTAPRPGTFKSLSNRNFRIYLTGQTISMAGTWMQAVGQGWLVLKLTGSGTALGLVGALQFLPILLLGAMSGVIVDRVDRRKLYALTQAVCGSTALALGVLTATGMVRLWMIYVLAGLLGLVTAIDQPTKIAFLYDMVGPEDLTNAVSLNQAMNNLGRIIGPALAGLVIGLLGIAPCFLINALSFVAVIVALLSMRAADLHVAPVQPRRKGQVREGLEVVRRSPELLALLVMAALFFGLAWMADIVMPLIARYTFHGGATLYGLFLTSIGVGAIGGALYTARQGDPSRRLLGGAGVAVGVSCLAAAVAPWMWLEMVLMLPLGAAGSTFIATLSSRIQLQTPIEVRGRVMALWSMAAIGSRPFGAPIVGAVGQHFGPRYAMGLAAVSVLLLALPTWLLLSARGARRSDARSYARTSAATEPSTPLTNRPDSSVEKRLASSTASEMTAPVGTSARSRSS